MTWTFDTVDTITQTGTDTDLSGLNGVSGITTTTLGNQTLYVSDHKIQIDGTLTHDPETEILFIKHTAPRPCWKVSLGASLLYGSNSVTDADTGSVIYPSGCGLYICREIGVGENQSSISFAGMQVEGTFTWYGGTICCNSSAFMHTNSTLTWRDAVLTMTSTSGTPRLDIGQTGSTVDIKGLKFSGMAGGNATLRGLILRKDATYTALEGVDIRSCAIALLGNGGNAASSAPLTFTNSPAQELYNARIWGLYVNTQMVFFNYATGNKLIDTALIDRWNNANGIGAMVNYKQIGFNVATSAGSGINGAKVYIKDSDNGGRPSAAQVTNWTGYTYPAFNGDLDYTWTCDAQGDAAAQDVATCYATSTDGISFIADNRTNNNSLDAGQFNYYVYAYGYLIGTGTVSINGASTLTQKVTGVPDLLITEATKATVDAYTGLETAQKVYDYMRSWKEQSANFALPALDVTPLNRSGSTIEAGTYNVNVDSAAASVFGFSGSNITWKAASYSGGISTSGDVTTFGTTTVEGVVIDGANSVDFAVFPSAATINNSTQGLIIFDPGTYDFSAWSFSGNTADITVSDSVGAVTIITGGQTLTIDEGTGNTVTIDNSVDWTFSFEQTGGTFAMLDADRWKTWQGVYASHAAAQAAILTPVAGDYYAVDSNSDGVRDDHGYYDGSAWVEYGSGVIYEHQITSSDIGGAGAGATEVISLRPNTNWRWYYDTLNYIPKTGVIAVAGASGSTAVSLSLNSSFNGIAAAVYTDIKNNYLPSVVITAPNTAGIVDVYLPTLPAGDIERAIVLMEYMQLDLKTAQSALEFNDPGLYHIQDSKVFVENDEVRFNPLTTYPAQTKVIFPANVEKTNYTIDIAPYDSNGNYVCINDTAYNVVNAATISGEIPGIDALQYQKKQIYVNAAASPGALGTYADPVATISEAEARAIAQGTKEIIILSDVTLDASIDGYLIEGHVEHNIDLNGQTVGQVSTGATIKGVGITGTGVGFADFYDCEFYGTATVQGHMHHCGFQSTVTMNGDLYGEECYSLVAGASTPTINKNGFNLAMLRYSGGLQIDSCTGGNTSLDFVSGQLILDATCTGGTIYASGAYALTNNALGTVLDQAGRTAVSQDADTYKAASVTVDYDLIADAVWDEVIDNATHNAPNSAGKRLRQAGTLLAADGQVTGTPTASTFTTTLTNATNEFYDDQTLVFLSGALEGQARVITSYNGTTKAVTFDEPFTVAPSATDDFEIRADHVHPIDQIQAGLSTFDPAVDTVARVTLVDTTTANTDMRGTDNALLAASYTAPDNAGIAAIPTNPLLTNDVRLDNLDAPISSSGLDQATFDARMLAVPGSTKDGFKADVSALATQVSVDGVPNAVLTQALTESYAAKGVAPTVEQALMLLTQHATEFGISGTTISIKGLDGITEVATLTLDDATVPTSKTRAT